MRPVAECGVEAEVPAEAGQLLQLARVSPGGNIRQIDK